MVALPELVEAPSDSNAFEVSLPNFSGPFDLLLGLVAKHRLDVTEVSLAQVTDEFIAHMGQFPDLSEATEFLVVAATLLDIKAARLLPQGEAESEEDLAALEARDLLFARLLQYRAFKEASYQISEQLTKGALTFPRNVPLEPHFAALLPELVMQIDAEELARRAAEVLFGNPTQVVVSHLHDPVVSVAEQATLLASRLATVGKTTFAELISDAQFTAVVISRFLALLELYREGVISISQEGPLSVLNLEWSGKDAPDRDFSERFTKENIDEYRD